jgi:hypothetical protein
MYELTNEQYKSLLESNQGVTIYGDSFPPNINVFKTQKAKYEAVLELFYLVQNICESSGANAEVMMEFIQGYASDIGDIAGYINAGLITEDDMKDIVRYLDDLGDDE